MYINKSLREYLDDLASKKAAPGGGSAAALSAAIGAGLMSMVANYTTGNPKYKSVDAVMADILVRVTQARQDLESLIDADVNAYEKLSKAVHSAPKGSTELEKLYKEAARVPLDTCKICADCLKLCKELALKGNKNLVTDTAIAAILLEGAFFSAKYNVYINLKYIKDMEFIGSAHAILSPLEDSMPKLKEEILELCEDVISK